MGFDLLPPDLSFGSLCEFYAPYALDFFGVEFLSKILQKEPNWMNDWSKMVPVQGLQSHRKLKSAEYWGTLIYVRRI